MFDIDFDFDGFDLGFDFDGGLDLPFLDDDFGAGSALLPIFFIGAIIVGSIFALVNIVAGNIGFLLAGVFFISTLFFLPNRKKQKTEGRSLRARHQLATICFLAFIGFASWGAVIYQEKAEEARIQEEIRAEQEAAEAAHQAEEKARIAAENKKIGMWGRTKRWMWGSGE